MHQLTEYSEDEHFNLPNDGRTAVKNVCDEMNVPFIDLWSRTTEFFEAAERKRLDCFWNVLITIIPTQMTASGGNIVVTDLKTNRLKQCSADSADRNQKDMINVEIRNTIRSVKPQKSKENRILKTIGLVGNVQRPSLPMLTGHRNI